MKIIINTVLAALAVGAATIGALTLTKELEGLVSAPPHQDDHVSPPNNWVQDQGQAQVKARAPMIGPLGVHSEDAQGLKSTSALPVSTSEAALLPEEIAQHMHRTAENLIDYIHSNPNDLSAHYALALHNGVVTPDYFARGQHIIDHKLADDGAGGIDLSARKHDLIGFRDMGFYYLVAGCPGPSAIGYRGDPGQYFVNNLPQPSTSVYSFMTVKMFPKLQCRSSDGKDAGGHTCGELHDPDQLIRCVQNE